MALKILLNGSRGRMGKAVLALAEKSGIDIRAEISRGEDPKEGMPACDVAIDFSVREATVPLLEIAAAHGKPVVIGTTGHTEAEGAAINRFSRSLPVVWSGNFSIGVNLLYYLTEKAAGTLDGGYQPEIIESHHRFKADAPSGTAEALIDIIRKSRHLPEEACRFGRRGMVGERRDEEIGVHSVRAGDIVGEHTVLFAGPGERLELTHRASDRSIFAEGAIQAALWIVHQKPGLYSMRDVLQMET